MKNGRNGRRLTKTAGGRRRRANGDLLGLGKGGLGLNERSSGNSDGDEAQHGPTAAGLGLLLDLGPDGESRSRNGDAAAAGPDKAGRTADLEVAVQDGLG